MVTGLQSHPALSRFARLRQQTRFGLATVIGSKEPLAHGGVPRETAVFPDVSEPLTELEMRDFRAAVPELGVEPRARSSFAKARRDLNGKWRTDDGRDANQK
jgi:hypothetical protein